MKNKLAPLLLTLLSVLSFNFSAMAANPLALGQPAPLFKAKTQAGADFDLASRKGSWTVLYFYPKAETPGCTKQACAFRDNLEKIRQEGAEVFGISSNSVEEQAGFHKHHNLNFTLLADPNAEISTLYGSKMLFLKMSQRWTFIIDPDLKIRKIDKNVDPVMDAEHMAKSLAALKAAPAPETKATK